MEFQFGGLHYGDKALGTGDHPETDGVPLTEFHEVSDVSTTRTGQSTIKNVDAVLDGERFCCLNSSYPTLPQLAIQRLIIEDAPEPITPYGLVLTILEDLLRSWPFTNDDEVLDGGQRFQSKHFVDAGLHLSLIHISEPTRLLSISYAVFCLKKKKIIYYL